MASIDPQTILDTAGGPVPTVYHQADSKDQAHALRRLGAFMLEHPDLPPLGGLFAPTRFGDQVRVQAQTWAEDDTAAVATWAKAGGVQVQVRRFDAEKAHVSAEVEVAEGYTVLVWNHVTVAEPEPASQRMAGLLRDAMQQRDETPGGAS